MKDLLIAGILVFICIGLWASVPVFAIIVGTGMAVLFLSYIIKASKEDDTQGQGS